LTEDLLVPSHMLKFRTLRPIDFNRVSSPLTENCPMQTSSKRHVISATHGWTTSITNRLVCWTL